MIARRKSKWSRIGNGVFALLSSVFVFRTSQGKRIALESFTPPLIP